MSENIDKKLQQIIDLEIRELYDLAFFKPYLVNYIADFKPQFHQSMSDREYRDYLERKNEEAIQEFCARFAVYDIPHFGFAVFALNAHGIVVVRMNLYRQVVFCVDQLD